jgi:hypothetical protein
MEASLIKPLKAVKCAIIIIIMIIIITVIITHDWLILRHTSQCQYRNSIAKINPMIDVGFDFNTPDQSVIHR